MTTPEKGVADYYAEGDWNAQCDQCGRKRKGSTLVDTWNGLKVCPEHGDAVIKRQPQDFVRGIADNQMPPWTRPKTTETFINFCTPNSTSAVPGQAIPGCVIPGYLSPSYVDGAPE